LIKHVYYHRFSFPHKLTTDSKTHLEKETKTNKLQTKKFMIKFVHSLGQKIKKYKAKMHVLSASV